PLGDGLRGTLPFLAPEVLSGAFADGRSDLYSLGISILWAVTGRSPFPEKAEEAARAIQSGAVLDLPALCPAAPEGLREVTPRLVRPRSDERFPDAMALVGELERIGGLPRLGRARALRTAVPLVGWEREMSLIAGEVDALVQGESERSVVVVESDPG